MPLSMCKVGSNGHPKSRSAHDQNKGHEPGARGRDHGKYQGRPCGIQKDSLRVNAASILEMAASLLKCNHGGNDGIVCRYYKMNAECKKNACPYYKADDDLEIAGRSQ